MSQKEAKPINKQLAELKAKIDWFYGEDFNLDDAIARYEEVVKLSQQLDKQLGELKNKVEVLSRDFSQ
jgi:exonuclease VII small subunit